MQWSLFAVVHIVNALFGASFASAENGKGQISKTFEAFGYSPACVVSALTSCEFSSTKELSIDVVDSIEVTKSLLQEMKSEIKAIRQEIKSTEENSSSEVKSLLQEMKSEIKAIRQEMKSVEENSSSVVNSLLQEMKSDREISVSEVKAIRQEIKSDGENSSSVVKNLLQEMQSEIGNSVSEIKYNLQEEKRELENVTDSSQSRDGAISGGTTATPKGKELPKNCAELQVLGDELSGGVQTVYPYFPNQKPVVVYCDQVTDGGGWTVIQSRSPLPIRENFTRNWDEYAEGFGDLKGEFWLGLDNIHALTNSVKMELRIDMEASSGNNIIALYKTFHVGDAASKYVLRIEDFWGPDYGGDGMTYTYENQKMWNLNGMKFSTHDNDNDLTSWRNCAEDFKGGWWFNRCSIVNLNGLPIVGADPMREGIIWARHYGWVGHSMRKANMKIRPK